MGANEGLLFGMNAEMSVELADTSEQLQTLLWFMLMFSGANSFTALCFLDVSEKLRRHFLDLTQRDHSLNGIKRAIF